MRHSSSRQGGSLNSKPSLINASRNSTRSAELLATMGNLPPEGLNSPKISQVKSSLRKPLLSANCSTLQPAVARVVSQMSTLLRLRVLSWITWRCFRPLPAIDLQQGNVRRWRRRVMIDDLGSHKRTAPDRDTLCRILVRLSVRHAVGHLRNYLCLQ